MKSQDALENYLVYGIHIPNRKIYFGAASASEGEPGDQSDFGHCSVALAIRAIDLMVSMNSKPIEIHMSSYGGDPYFMLALKDKILESPVQFKFYGRGRIASAATWVMAVCDERYLSEDTVIMVHKGSTYYQDFTGKLPVTDTTIDAEHDEALQDKLNQIFADNSRMPKKFWDILLQRDCFMTAEEAISLGLADEVIPHRKRLQFRKKRQKALEAHPGQKSLQNLTKKLLKRIKMDSIADSLEVHIPQELQEDIPQYDNTAIELEKLDIKDVDNGDQPVKVG